MNEPAKIEKVTDEALSRSIISSVIGILLCMVCLVGTTWAWYSLSVESDVSVTEGANFDFNVAVTKNLPETTDQPVAPQDGQYSLVENVEYTVTLTKTGTATKSFCKVEATKTGEETNPSYYIVDFTGKEPAEFISFTVTGFDTLKLIPMWGTPADSYTKIPDGGIIPPLPALNALPPTKAVVSQEETASKKEEPIDDETDDKEKIGDSTDDNGTIEPDEDDENVNENEVPDETPANPEQTEPEEKSEESAAETTEPNQGQTETSEQSEPQE